MFTSIVSYFSFPSLSTVAAANMPLNTSISLSTPRISVITVANKGIGPSTAVQNDCCALRKAGGTSIPNQLIGLDRFPLALDFSDSVEIFSSSGSELREDALEFVSSFPFSVTSFGSIALGGDSDTLSTVNDGLLLFLFELKMVGFAWVGMLESG